jgi:hypothetical protein
MLAEELKTLIPAFLAKYVGVSEGQQKQLAGVKVKAEVVLRLILSWATYKTIECVFFEDIFREEKNLWYYDLLNIGDRFAPCARVKTAMPQKDFNEWEVRTWSPAAKKWKKSSLGFSNSKLIETQVLVELPKPVTQNNLKPECPIFTLTVRALSRPFIVKIPIEKGQEVWAKAVYDYQPEDGEKIEKVPPIKYENQF